MWRLAGCAMLSTHGTTLGSYSDARVLVKVMVEITGLDSGDNRVFSGFYVP